MAEKRGRTVSVVLPALNEAETVGQVVDTITPMLGGLVDELIVLDSGSTDDTEARAYAAGARSSTVRMSCRRSRRSPERARRCGGRWPQQPVTSWCSSTPTSSTPIRCSCRDWSARC